MLEDLKNKFKENPMLYRTVMVITNVVILAMVTYFIREDNKWKAESEMRMFSDGQKMLLTEQFILKVYDPKTNEFRYFSHITDPGIHMTQDAKDSIYITRQEFVRYQRQMNAERFDMMNRFINHEEKTNALMEELRADQKTILNYLKDLAEKQ